MKFLSKKHVRDKVLYSFAHIARLEAAGKFPKRVQLGPGRVGWVEEEIEQWCRARIALRDGNTSSS
jgi:prophage regulatory protein